MDQTYVFRSGVAGFEAKTKRFYVYIAPSFYQSIPLVCSSGTTWYAPSHDDATHAASINRSHNTHVLGSKDSTSQFSLNYIIGSSYRLPTITIPTEYTFGTYMYHMDEEYIYIYSHIGNLDDTLIDLVAGQMNDLCLGSRYVYTPVIEGYKYFNLTDFLVEASDVTFDGTIYRYSSNQNEYTLLKGVGFVLNKLSGCLSLDNPYFYMIDCLTYPKMEPSQNILDTRQPTNPTLSWVVWGLSAFIFYIGLVFIILKSLKKL